MACQLKKGSRQRFAGRRPKHRIVSALLEFVFDGADEPVGHIALGGSPDADIAVCLGSADLAFEVYQAPGEAFQHFTSFLRQVGKLPIGEAWKISNEDLAVITKREVSRLWAAVEIAGGSWRRALRTIRIDRTGLASASGEPPGAGGGENGTLVQNLAVISGAQLGFRSALQFHRQ